MNNIQAELHLKGYPVCAYPELFWICDDNDCAGMLLSILVSWTHTKKDNRQLALSHNAMQRRRGMPISQITDLWIWMSYDEFEYDLGKRIDPITGKTLHRSKYSRTVIVNAIRLLEKKGYIESRFNQANKLDRKKQYLVDIDAVNGALDNLPDYSNPYNPDSSPDHLESTIPPRTPKRHKKSPSSKNGLTGNNPHQRELDDASTESKNEECIGENWTMQMSLQESKNGRCNPSSYPLDISSDEDISSSSLHHENDEDDEKSPPISKNNFSLNPGTPLEEIKPLLELEQITYEQIPWGPAKMVLWIQQQNGYQYGPDMEAEEYAAAQEYFSASWPDLVPPDESYTQQIYDFIKGWWQSASEITIQAMVKRDLAKRQIPQMKRPQRKPATRLSAGQGQRQPSAHPITHLHEHIGEAPQFKNTIDDDFAALERLPIQGGKQRHAR